MTTSHQGGKNHKPPKPLAHTSKYRPLLCAAILLTAIQTMTAAQQTPARITRTPEQVETLIKNVGANPPQWWGSVELKYPDTLNLDWPLKPGDNWNNQKNVGQYIWDVINPNPSRWQEGIKLVNHLMIKHKDDRAKLARATQTLGSMFNNFMQDYPRAVFWWRISARYGARVDPARLADCYWQMGCEQMARDILVRIRSDYTRNGHVIKLWADMGQLNKALQLAEQKAANAMPHIAYLAAGNACRQAGKYPEAQIYYQKVVAAKLPAKENNDFSRAVEQAKENLQAMRLYQMLDLARIPDGKYPGRSTAFNGPLHVQVTVTNARIESLQVTQHREKQFYSALTDTPSQILDKQTLTDIDAVTGATITSEAIITATAAALAEASK